MRCNILNKIKFVNELSEVISKYHEGVMSVQYRVFEEEYFGDREEFLIVNYKGGAKSIRNCTGNSFSAIFDELSKYLDTGYYSELEYFKTIENDPKWIEMTLEQLEKDYLLR